MTTTESMFDLRASRSQMGGPAAPTDSVALREAKLVVESAEINFRVLRVDRDAAGGVVGWVARRGLVVAGYHDDETAVVTASVCADRRTAMVTFAELIRSDADHPTRQASTFASPHDFAAVMFDDADSASGALLVRVEAADGTLRFIARQSGVWGACLDGEQLELREGHWAALFSELVGIVAAVEGPPV